MNIRGNLFEEISSGIRKVAAVPGTRRIQP